MSTASHVFIVGKPRSGTSLVREILNNSPDIAITGETHTFPPPRVLKALVNLLLGRPAATLPGSLPLDFRSRTSSRRLPYSRRYSKLRNSETGPQSALDPDNSALSYWKDRKRSDLYQLFVDAYLRSDRTCKHFLDLVMEGFASGKPVKGEKTPAHLNYVPTLLSWYPEAVVIHVIRDARGVFESQKSKWRTEKAKNSSSVYRLIHSNLFSNEIYSMFCNLVTWLRAAQLDQDFSRRFPGRYYLLRYEDLVCNPEPSVRELCAFIGVAYEPNMLDHSFDNSSFPLDTTFDENCSSGGFFPDRAYRWQSTISPWSDRTIRLIARKELRRLGYIQ